MGKSIAAKPLDVIERGELRIAEATIERGELTFIEVGNALLTIRDGRLYRETHKTFEAYCRERWGFAKSQAYRLIAAANVTAEMSPTGDKLKTESQARELGKVPAEKRESVLEWAEEKAAGTGKPVTAAGIRKAAADLEEEVDDDIPNTPADRMKVANAEIESIARQIGDIIKAVEASTNPHLAHERAARATTATAQLRSAAATLRAGKGAGPCPYCKGKGCKTCYDTGWVNKITLESAPEK